MAMSKRDYEAQASIISANLADVATPLGFVIDNTGLLAVTRIAIGLMNHAYAGDARFDGRKFIEWAGLTPWVEIHEGFATKEARWTEATRKVAGYVAEVEAYEKA